MRHKLLLTLLLLAASGTAWLLVTGGEHRDSTDAVLAMENPTPAEPWKAIDGRDYYVSNTGDDNHDGSRSHPWASVQHAALNAVPGATIHVLPGFYSGPVVSKRNGEAAARIRFISEQQWQARIVTTLNAASWTNYGSYVDIAGFDVTGSGAHGILNYGSNVRMVGNYVHDVAAAGCREDGGAGIDDAEYSAHDDDIIGNVVVRIGDPDIRCNRVHGIYHSNLRGHIWNNISCDNQGWGIHLWHAPNAVVIANNLVCHNGEGGIVIGAGEAPGVLPADHMLVTNNILFANGRHGPGYAIEEFGSLGSNNQYANNLIYGPQQQVSLTKSSRAMGFVWKDPKFMNEMADGRADYHLSANSPAIGMGTATGAPPFDLEGRLRPVSGHWDVGPYQYHSQGKPWPWY